MYPVLPDKFDSVGINKSSFGDADKLPTKLKLGGSSEKNVKYLSCDPGTKYTNSYKEKNISDIRQLSTKTSNVQTLLWQTSLRGENFNRHKLPLSQTLF